MGSCTSSRDFGPEKGQGSGAFCLKICDILAQQDEFSTALWSRLVVRKVRNERNLFWIFTILSGFFSCFNKLAFEVEFLLDFRE